MSKLVPPACLAFLVIVLQATVGHAEEAARMPLSSAEIEAYQSIADGKLDHLSAAGLDSGEILIAALAALGILFLVLIIA